MTEILRKGCIVLLVIMILIVIIGSFGLFGQNFLAGLLYLIVGIVATLFYAGFLFLFLDMAEDVEYIKYKIMEIDRKNNKDKEEIKDGWKCEECGRVNHSYTGTCACGKAK
ncbi:MAG: DUF3899 domain-containing protein [Clostridia bacterium]|nr:DUF3899 domain-containing protein [Clostridia bacterium]